MILGQLKGYIYYENMFYYIDTKVKNNALFKYDKNLRRFSSVGEIDYGFCCRLLNKGMWLTQEEVKHKLGHEIILPSEVKKNSEDTTS